MKSSIILLALILLACDKTEPQQPTPPQCQCYEVSESLETVTVNGFPQPQWVLQYESSPTQQPCTNETDWTYNNNNTERFKTVCE